jgi:hypothetical protein
MAAGSDDGYAAIEEKHDDHVVAHREAGLD